MVRNKPQPQQLNEQQQRRAQWNLLDGAGAAGNAEAAGNNVPRREEAEREPENNLALLINDELIEDDDDDVDFVPGAFGDPALRQREFLWGRLPPRRPDEEEEEIEVESDDEVVEVVSDDDDDDDFVYRPVPRRERQRRPRRVNFDDDEIQVIPQPVRQRVRRPKVGLDYGDFKEVLNDCQLYCKILINENLARTSHHRSSEGIFCHFGEMTLKLKDKLTEEEFSEMPCNEFWVYVSLETDKSAVYFEWASGASPSKAKKLKATNFRHCMIEGTLDLEFWQGLSTQRYFKVSLTRYDETKQEMTIDVLFKKSGLTELKFASDGSQSSVQIGQVISYFSGVSLIMFTGEKTLKHDIEELYEAVKLAHTDKEYCGVDVQHTSLIPKLRPYQKAAVRWMLHQEKFNRSDEVAETEKSAVHCLYAQVVSKDGITFYFNKYSGSVVKDKPLAVLPSPGGILADEMGLGKTVEVLSCMLMHTRKDVPKPEYQRPVKVEQQQPRKSKGKKTDHGDDIFTLEYKSDEDGDADMCYQSLTNNGSTTDVQDDESLVKEEHDATSPPVSSRGRRKRRSSGHVKVYIPPKIVSDDEEEEKNKSSRPKRRAARHKGGYEDCDYFPEEEEDHEEEYEPVEKKVLKTPQKKTKYNVEDEIANDDMWPSIEAAIVKECWNGSYKDYKKEGSHKEFRKFLKQRKKDPYYMMTLKQRLDIQYKNAIAAYSAAPAVSRRGCTGFFDTKVAQKSFFECLCGSSEAESCDDKFRVQCIRCSLWQHADCVQFDVSDPYRGEYVCPHCWTQETPVVSGATLIVTPSSISYQVCLCSFVLFPP